MSWQQQGIELPFTGGFAETRSRYNSSQECVNYRPNINTKAGLSQECLYQTEGINQLIASTEQAPCRGSHTMNGINYKVIGTTLYKITLVVNPDLSETWAKTSQGTILGSNRVIMKSIWSGTGYEMAIVDPGNYAYYYLESTGSVSNLTGLSNFLSPVIDCEDLNGFMFFVQQGTNKVFHSNLNNIATYNALDFELVTRIPDVKGIMEFRGQLLVFGEDQTLPYSFIGGSNFVIQYQPNSTLPGGIRNQYAKTTSDEFYCYLGGGKNSTTGVWISSGGYPTKISDESIDYIIRGNSLLDFAYLLDFSIDGGRYIALQVGTNCFVYDFYSQRWHTRTSNNDLAPWRANHISKAYDRLVVGDALDGRVGELTNSDTEYGDNVNRYFVTRPFDYKGRFIRVKSIMVVMDVGFSGSLTMDYSDDGGNNWSDPVTVSAGVIGDYGNQIVYDRLSTTPFSRVFRFGTDSGVKANICKVLAL